MFDVFLPQLLAYPNPQDPLNSEAASLLTRDKERYEQRVRGTPADVHLPLLSCVDSDFTGKSRLKLQH